MGLTQLDIIRKQIESAAKNRAAGEAAKLRRKTSLIGEISRLTGKANRTIDQAGREAVRWRAGRRPDILEDEAEWDERDESTEAPYICADGYVRRSPEQPLYTPPDYRRRLLRRAAGIAVAVLLALAVLWLLVHYSVLSI